MTTAPQPQTDETSSQISRISLHGVSKSFNAGKVLDDVTLDFRSGELTGLMGPNGAGKSTLLKILDGLYVADEGRIEVDGAPVASLGETGRVAFVHQDLGLIDDMTVADNLNLGRSTYRRAGVLLNRHLEERAAVDALARVNLHVSPGMLLSDLSQGEKTLVAVARACAQGAEAYFIDEATSNLTVHDAKIVTDALHAFASTGAIVVMITHKLSEVLDNADRVIVLLDGKVSADLAADGLDRGQLVQELVVREAVEAPTDADTRVASGPQLLTFEKVRGERLARADISIRCGEIVGISGMAGSGLHEIAFLAMGEMTPHAGRIVEATKVRAALVPPRRESQGGFADLDVAKNMTVSSLPRWRRFGRLLSLRLERENVENMIKALTIRPSDADIPYGVLSGGNKQKVIFARALMNRPNLFILCEPTRGVDIQTRAEIYRMIRRMPNGDCAVLVLSSDAEDLFAVCDRIGLIRDGIVDELRPTSELTIDDLEEMV